MSRSSCDDNKRVENKPDSLYLKVVALFFYFTSFLLVKLRKKIVREVRKKQLAYQNFKSQRGRKILEYYKNE